MKNRIGETAGEIWKVLKQKEEVNLNFLPRMLGEKAQIVHQAVGWLAREDKIEYRTRGGKTFISLTPSEKIK